MNYLLDTNTLLIYLRDHEHSDFINKTYDPLGPSNLPIISVVTVGEIKSIAIRNNWGNRRLDKLEEFLNQFVIADINSEDVIDRYAEIDAYSQGKLKDNPLGMTARNMGKNDLWIAATASITNSTLITTDNDFNHLEDKFIKLVRIEIHK